MPQITLTPEQATLFHQSKEPVAVCDTNGKIIGVLPPDYSVEFIADLKRRANSGGPWYSGAEVQSMFQFVEAAEKREGILSKDRVDSLVREFESQHGTRS